MKAIIAFIPALTWAAVIFLLSTGEPAKLPGLSSFSQADKLAHALAYFVLTGLLGWGFHRSGFAPLRLMAAAFMLSVLFGLGMEIVQYAFFPNRFFEILDIFANIIGSMLSVFAFNFLNK